MRQGDELRQADDRFPRFAASIRNVYPKIVMRLTWVRITARLHQSSLHAAFLVLLPAATWARLVTADLICLPDAENIRRPRCSLGPTLQGSVEPRIPFPGRLQPKPEPQRPVWVDGEAKPPICFLRIFPDFAMGQHPVSSTREVRWTTMHRQPGL